MKKTLFLILCLSAAFTGCGPAEFLVSKKIEDKTFIDSSYVGITSIRASQTALPVRVVSSTSGKTEVKCYVERISVNRTKYRIVAQVKGTQLEINELPRKGLSFRGKISGYLEIAVPPAVEEVSLSTVSGKIEVHAPVSARIEAATVSGNISVRDSLAPQVQARTVSGGVSLCLGQSVRKVSAKTVSGGISMQLGQEVETVDAKTVSGDIRLRLPGDLKDNSYDMSTVSGSIDIQGVGKSRGKLGLDFGEGRAQVRLTSVSGDLEVTRSLENDRTKPAADTLGTKDKE